MRLIEAEGVIVWMKDYQAVIVVTVMIVAFEDAAESMSYYLAELVEKLIYQETEAAAEVVETAGQLTSAVAIDIAIDYACHVQPSVYLIE